MIKIRIKKTKKSCGKTKIVENNVISTIKEVTDEELEHIKIAKLLEPEDLAFSDLFGDKRRIIIDFEQLSSDTKLGKFVNMFKEMNYEVDWNKGMVTGVREYSDVSPAALAKQLLDMNPPEDKPRKIHMKIGKWLRKTSDYALKLDALTNKIAEFNNYDIQLGRITGNMVEAALSEEEVANYYRNSSLLQMMVEPNTRYFRNNPYALQKWAQWWQLNAGSIKRELENVKHNDDVIIITRHPIDVFRMSDFENITSCHSPPSRQSGHLSQQYKCAVAEAHGHGAVAYVVDREELLDEYGVDTLEGVERQIQDADHELFYDDERVNDGAIEPKYRVRLRQMRYWDDESDSAFQVGGDRSGGTEIAVPERRMYPEGLPGFVERVMKWSREEQTEKLANAPRKDDALNMDQFIKFGGSYEDNIAQYLLADLFAQQFNEFVGRPIQDTDTEDELESDLNLDLVKSMNLEIDQTEAKWNEHYDFCGVEGVAEYDGEEDIFVSVRAWMYFEWPVEEWKSLPLPNSLEYVVDELRDMGAGMVARGDGTYSTDWLAERGSRIERWKIGTGKVVAHIKIDPEKLMDIDSWMEVITGGPSGFDMFCQTLKRVDRVQAPQIKSFIESYYMREGAIDGGGILNLAREIENGEYRYTDWKQEVQGEVYDNEVDGIDISMMIEVPNENLPQLAKFINDNKRDINIEVRKRIMAEPREYANTEYYLSAQITEVHDTGRGEVYIGWLVDLPYDANDEMAELMKQILEEVTEEELTEAFESVIKQMIQNQQLSETKRHDANWALKRWKNNFI